MPDKNRRMPLNPARSAPTQEVIVPKYFCRTCSFSLTDEEVEKAKLAYAGDPSAAPLDFDAHMEAVECAACRGEEE